MVTKKEKVICGAKNRAGNPCQKRPLKGRTRCKMHGGASTGAPKGNKNTVKHGIYSKFFSDEELHLAEDIELGNVDLELKALRIQLRRAYEQQKKSLDDIANGGDGCLITNEIEDMSGSDGGYNKVIKRAVDYNYIITQLSSRIESLERTRLALNQASGQFENEPEYDNEYTLAPDEPTPEGGAVL